MFTLAQILCQYNHYFALLLDSLTWTAKRAQLFENLSKNVPIISGMRVRNCQKNVKKINFLSSLPEVFFKTLSWSLSLNKPATCNYVLKGAPAQLFSYIYCELSGQMLLIIAIICQEHFKLNVRRMTYLLILMTSA